LQTAFARAEAAEAADRFRHEAEKHINPNAPYWKLPPIHEYQVRTVAFFQ